MAIKPKDFGKMTDVIANKISTSRYDVQLAETEEQIQAAQHLRYEVLFKESGGRLTREMLTSQREEDEWDAIAYHVVVVDKQDKNEVLGTVRLVSSAKLNKGQQFYTEQAFDLSKLRERYDHILELSRACVTPEGRSGAILLLMWKFCMQFIEQNKFDVMLGCASFHGTDYQEHREILSYLYQKHLAPPELMPKPVVDNFVAITDIKAPEGDIDTRGKVPTLLKGYLKVGAFVSEDAIIDPLFNTTFVAIYVDASQMFSQEHTLVYKS